VLQIDYAFCAVTVTVAVVAWSALTDFAVVVTSKSKLHVGLD
jgi:hypothetical protein